MVHKLIALHTPMGFLLAIKKVIDISLKGYHFFQRLLESLKTSPPLGIDVVIIINVHYGIKSETYNAKIIQPINT